MPASWPNVRPVVRMLVCIECTCASHGQVVVLEFIGSEKTGAKLRIMNVRYFLSVRVLEREEFLQECK